LGRKLGPGGFLPHETNETIDDITRKNRLVKPAISNAEQTEEHQPLAPGFLAS
jgi:hypothetical protein